MFKMYVDLDGVLSDFEGRVSEILGKPIREASSSEIWKGVYRYDMDVQPFFGTLNKLHDADELWEFVTGNFDNVEILTATGFTPKNAAVQKKEWCKNNLLNCAKVNTVKRSAGKANLACPKSILIDDRAQSIDPWVERGGIGILHTSAENTIRELAKYL